jgi:hypothetical protein
VLPAEVAPAARAALRNRLLAAIQPAEALLVALPDSTPVEEMAGEVVSLGDTEPATTDLLRVLEDFAVVSTEGPATVLAGSDSLSPAGEDAALDSTGDQGRRGGGSHVRIMALP